MPRYSPWLWIPSLFTAQEIPSAVVTFVALLMFVQFGVNDGWASTFISLLFLPWVMKSYLRTKVRNAGRYKLNIHRTEALLFASLIGTALYINYFTVNTFVLVAILFVVALLCAVHELLSQMYYNRMLYPRQQRLYDRTKFFSLQSTLVITYGVLIIFVGFLEVFFRSIRKAWAMGSYLAAGAVLVLIAINLIVLQNPRIHNPYRYESLLKAFRNELHVVERIRRKKHAWKVALAFFMLMLPQSLMFNTRVFFLLADPEKGGLGCSIQEVGFAQGTIGVLAFSLGIVSGRGLTARFGGRRMFWWYAVLLTLSPVFYLAMAHNPIIYNDMAMLCTMTFLAQMCFGLGLNICMTFVKYISNERYRNTVNYLYIPFVSMSMIVPMAASGWIEMAVGFRHFFTIDVCCAPVAWVAMILLHTKEILCNENKTNTMGSDSIHR